MVSGLMLTTNGLDELPLVELWKPSNLAPSPWKSAIIELYGKKKKVYRRLLVLEKKDGLMNYNFDRRLTDQIFDI
jgi:hypothetical protein